MPKKEVKKTAHRSKTSKHVRKPNLSGEINVEKALVENFIALQKVMTNLSGKFDNLSKKIEKLLELFEISAKAVVDKEFKSEKKGEGKDLKELSEKLDKLLDQNKTIAKGIAYLYDDEGKEPPESLEEKGKPDTKQGTKKTQQAPQQPGQPQRKSSVMELGDYEKSISAGQGQSQRGGAPKKQEQETAGQPINQMNQQQGMGMAGGMDVYDEEHGDKNKKEEKNQGPQNQQQPGQPPLPQDQNQSGGQTNEQDEEQNEKRKNPISY